MRLKQYSMRTEEAYEEWVCRFVLFQRKRDPRMEQAKSVPDSPCRLKRWWPSIQNQAKNALLFLYEEVLGVGPLALIQPTPAIPSAEP
jgi:hypothetical protein